MSNCRYYRTDWLYKNIARYHCDTSNTKPSIIGMVQKVKEHHVWHDRKRDHVKCFSLFFDFCFGEFTIVFNLITFDNVISFENELPTGTHGANV